MATATATDHGSTGILVPLLAAAANLVANDPDRPGGAEALTQIRETFTEFIGIVGEGEQMMVIQQDRSRRASEWEDTEDCDLYTGVCLGAYRERSEGGGAVTRIAVWVRAFDKERVCEDYEDARELWRDHRSDPDAFNDKTGVLYLNGIKSARAPFSHEMALDSPSQVIRAARQLQGHPVKMYRLLHEFQDEDDKTRQVGVVHRIELNPDADDSGADDGEVEEAPATKRGGTKAAGTSSRSRSGTKASSTKAAGTSSRSRSGTKASSTKASGTSSRSRSGTSSRSGTKPKAEPEPKADDDAADDDVPESKQALVKWATDQGIGRGTLSRFLEGFGFDGGLPGITEKNLAEAYEVIVEGIAEGKLGV